MQAGIPAVAGVTAVGGLASMVPALLGGGGSALGLAGALGLGVDLIGDVIAGEWPVPGEFFDWHRMPDYPSGQWGEPTVVKSWDTGTARFYLLNTGHITTRRKNGVWKRWKPPKHIVVSRNPRIGTAIRAEKRVTKLMKNLRRKAR